MLTLNRSECKEVITQRFELMNNAIPVITEGAIDKNDSNLKTFHYIKALESIINETDSFVMDEDKYNKTNKLMREAQREFKENTGE